MKQQHPGLLSQTHNHKYLGLVVFVQVLQELEWEAAMKQQHPGLRSQPHTSSSGAPAPPEALYLPESPFQLFHHQQVRVHSVHQV